MAIPDETFDVTVDIRPLVYATNEFITLGSSRVTFSDAVVCQLNNPKTETI